MATDDGPKWLVWVVKCSSALLREWNLKLLSVAPFTEAIEVSLQFLNFGPTDAEEIDDFTFMSKKI